MFLDKQQVTYLIVCVSTLRAEAPKHQQALDNLHETLCCAREFLTEFPNKTIELNYGEAKGI